MAMAKTARAERDRRAVGRVPGRRDARAAPEGAADRGLAPGTTLGA
jgi:hypothetical protein